MTTTAALMACKSVEGNSSASPAQPAATQQSQSSAMPEGRLVEVTYNYWGSFISQYSDFELKRNTGDGSGKLSFSYWQEQVTFDVPDSLFVRARQIIEEERMYEYDSGYHLPPEIERALLDGYSWRYSATFEGGQHLSSSGRQVSPPGDGLRKIEQLLNEAAERCVKENGLNVEGQ